MQSGYPEILTVRQYNFIQALNNEILRILAKFWFRLVRVRLYDNADHPTVAVVHNLMHGILEL